MVISRYCVLSALTSLLLAACGGGGDGPSNAEAGAGGGVSADVKAAEPAPVTLASFVGDWSGTFQGTIAGRCPKLSVFPHGSVTGFCENRTNGGSFPVSGLVNGQGAITFSGEDSFAGRFEFDGSLTSSTGSGPWTIRGRGNSGTWTLVKN